MPFPFLPAGAIVAASVLIAALSAFGLILRAMDRAIVGVRDSVLSGLVSGLRTWGSARPDQAVTGSPATTESPWGGLLETSPATPEPAAWSSETTEVFPPPEVVDLDSRSIDPEPVSRR